MVALPLWILATTLVFAHSGRFQFHRRIARWTFPLWLYVSVTGVVVYFMLEGLYGLTGSARTLAVPRRDSSSTLSPLSKSPAQTARA